MVLRVWVCFGAFLVCEGVRVLVCVLVFVCFLVVCLLFALFAACVGSSF